MTSPQQNAFESQTDSVGMSVTWKAGPVSVRRCCRCEQTAGNDNASVEGDRHGKRLPTSSIRRVGPYLEIWPFSPYLLIPRLLIFDSSACRGIPSFAAAP